MITNLLVLDLNGTNFPRGLIQEDSYISPLDTVSSFIVDTDTNDNEPILISLFKLIFK